MSMDGFPAEGPALLRLWLYVPHAAPLTWSVFRTDRGHLVRRTADIEVNPPNALGPLNAEAPLSKKEFDVILGELVRISICPAASCEPVLDAGYYGVEIDRHPTPVQLAWIGAAPVGWESLEAWHRRTLHRLDRLLPRATGLPYEFQTGGALSFDD